MARDKYNGQANHKVDSKQVSTIVVRVSFFYSGQSNRKVDSKQVPTIAVEASLCYKAMQKPMIENFTLNLPLSRQAPSFILSRPFVIKILELRTGKGQF